MGTKSLERLIRRSKVLLRTGKSSQMYISPFGTVSLCGECTSYLQQFLWEVQLLFTYLTTYYLPYSLLLMRHLKTLERGGGE